MFFFAEYTVLLNLMISGALFQSLACFNFVREEEIIKKQQKSNHNLEDWKNQNPEYRNQKIFP